MSMITDTVKGALSRSTRLLGPLLAQAGIVSAMCGWGGRVTDTLLRAAGFLGMPTTWVDNFRLWVDDPQRHDGLVNVALIGTGLLVLSLGRWAGSWLGEQEARRALLERARDDEKASMKLWEEWTAYRIARSTGTGDSTWLGLAMLMELQALNLPIILAGLGAATVLAYITHWMERGQASETPTAGESLGVTLLSLGRTSAISLGISLLGPELRLIGLATHAPVTPRAVHE